MKVYIITESGKDIGFGHVTRCLALVEALERLNHNVDTQFFINGDNSVNAVLKDRNYTILNWLNKNKLLGPVRDSTIVIVDSYKANLEFYKKISETVNIPVYIDDNKRFNYPAGIVLNSMIYADGLDYAKNENVTYLLGNQYAILRKEFWTVPPKSIKKNIKTILVTFGGDDKRKMTYKILKFLNKEYPRWKKTVVIGAGFKDKSKIEALKEANVNFIYNPDAEKMKSVMMESDLSISAGGQTIHELARLGVPSIGICIAKNQEKNLKSWHRKGFLKYIGWYNQKNLLEGLKNAISVLLPCGEREKRSQIGRKYIDGKGAGRIADFLVSKARALKA